MSGNSWGAKHKGLLAIAGAAAATAMTMGAASPALAAALGGTAAAEGAGAAGAGAGLLGAGAAAEGAGAAGLGGTAATLPGAVAGDMFMPAAEMTNVAGLTSPAAESSVGLLDGIKTAGRGMYQSALDSPISQKLGLSEVYPGPPSPGGSLPTGLSQNVMKTGDMLKSGMGKLSKAQAAYKLGSGLLGGQPSGGGGGGVPPSQAFGQRATPTNLTQYLNQPGPSQLPPQLAMLPPNDPRVLAYLQQMQGGMYG